MAEIEIVPRGTSSRERERERGKEGEQYNNNEEGILSSCNLKEMEQKPVEMDFE